MYGQTFAIYAETLKALAHPRRLEIVYLLKDQELCVGDIYSMLDLPQANVSQHLMILREAKLVGSRKDGKTICYKLAHPNIFAACSLIRDFLLEQNQDNQDFALLKDSLDDLLPITHDPVCQMRVSSQTAHYHTKHHNKNYYFCASGCLQKFKENPNQYVQTT
jgi:DNA-binding transcriptional ArsR family regulator/YHS domain-containing protein